MFMFFVSNLMMHDYANMWMTNAWKICSFLFLLDAMFMCQILICMNTWMHECMNAWWKTFLISLFLIFFSLFLFSSIVWSQLVLFEIIKSMSVSDFFFSSSHFLFSTLCFRKMGMSQILKLNFKIMFICLTFPFSTLMHACLIMDWWHREGYVKKILVEIETALCMLLLTIFSRR